MSTTTAYEISPPQAVDRKDCVDRYAGEHVKTYVKIRGRYGRMTAILEVNLAILHKLFVFSLSALFFRGDGIHRDGIHIVILAILHV